MFFLSAQAYSVPLLSKKNLKNVDFIILAFDEKCK